MSRSIQDVNQAHGSVEESKMIKHKNDSTAQSLSQKLPLNDEMQILSVLISVVICQLLRSPQLPFTFEN